LLDVDSLVDKFTAIKITISSINNIIAYNLYLWISSAVLGYSIKRIVRELKLDRKWKLLRFQNEWHYLITGEILDFPKILGEASDIDIVSVDAMVETNNGTIIYSGIIQDYLLSKQGGLELIYLTEVTRRYLKSDNLNNADTKGNSMQDGYYYIPGDFVVLPYKDIKNINISYYSIEEDEDNLIENE